MVLKTSHTLPSLRLSPVCSCAGPKGDHVKFPIDFFEHCVPLTSGDVDVSVQQSLAPQSYLSIDVCVHVPGYN